MRQILKTSAAVMAFTAAFATLGITAANGAKKDKKKEIIKTIGEPQNCINQRDIRSTRVIDSKTIEFHMIGRKTYRNIMTRNCPGLNKFDPISYEVNGSRLCHIESFTVLRTTSGRLEKFARCSFGKFQQIEKIKTKKSKKTE